MPTSARQFARPYPARACRIIPSEQPLPRWVYICSVLALTVFLAALYLDQHENTLRQIVAWWRG